MQYPDENAYRRYVQRKRERQVSEKKGALLLRFALLLQGIVAALVGLPFIALGLLILWELLRHLK